MVGQPRRNWAMVGELGRFALVAYVFIALDGTAVDVGPHRRLAWLH